MSDMSSVGSMDQGQYRLHEVSLVDCIGRRDVVSMAWFVWTGVWPIASVHQLLEACWVACIDHGEAPPSAQVTRLIASCGKPLADAVAGGVLTFGPRHGHAGGAASQWLRQALVSGRSIDALVDEALVAKQRLPGFGHKEYAVDPRTTCLVELANALLPSHRHLDLAIAVSERLSQKKATPLPLNVDGAVGAIMADIDAPAELADAIFLCARVIGLTAHARSQAQAGRSYLR